MAIAVKIADIIKNPASRREWIRMQLRTRGQTYRSFARSLGVSHQAVQATAGGKPSRRIEDALAAFCEMPAATLFWEHYAPDGSRIPIERATSRPGEFSSDNAAVHVESERAA